MTGLWPTSHHVCMYVTAADQRPLSLSARIRIMYTYTSCAVGLTPITSLPVEVDLSAVVPTKCEYEIGKNAGYPTPESSIDTHG